MKSSANNETGSDRLAELDVLRGVAVLMVLWHHADHFEAAIAKFPLWLWRVLTYSQTGGWSGVDLFFVLSGFLVSGLLFREYLRYGTIGYLRFYIRRGLKIYPAFYVMLATTVLVLLCQAKPFPWQPFISEALYIQSYFEGLWGHTWSLAVEEHFYLCLPLILFMAGRMSNGKSRANAFHRLPFIFVIAALAILCLRTWAVAHHLTKHSLWRVYFMTHTRLDAVLFGVCISWLHHFHPQILVRWVSRRRFLQLAFATACVLPPFIPRVTNVYNYSIGLTLNYIGYGLFLTHFIYWSSPIKDRLLKRLPLLRNIGKYSYSIYLWHVPLLAWWLPWLAIWIQNPALYFMVGCSAYLTGSVAIGILASKLIEFPVLHIRDRIFPSRCGPLTGLR